MFTLPVTLPQPAPIIDQCNLTDRMWCILHHMTKACTKLSFDRAILRVSSAATAPYPALYLDMKQAHRLELQQIFDVVFL